MITSTTNGFDTGDWVIYRKQKISSSPGERAQHVMPSTRGETYQYAVEKYWIVDHVASDGTVTLRTRRGKLHTLDADDPNLRKANWVERLIFRSRFTNFLSPDGSEAQPDLG